MNYFHTDKTFFPPFQSFQISYQAPSKVKQTDDLKISIQQLIEDLEQNLNQMHAITALTQRYNIKRRRLYDVINVFSSIGCCNKSGLDHLVWYGKSKLEAMLEQLKTNYHIHDKDLKLTDLFQSAGCIGISNLTICFLLLFFALKTNHLDLRFVGNLFSRQTSRYKTTLCKLYQISYILSSVGITNRTNQVCEVVLNKPFYNEELIPDLDESESDKNNPFSIMALLNNHEPTPASTSSSTLASTSAQSNYIFDRRKEFKDLFVQSIASKSISMQ